jgi:hypothetical protein
MQQSFFRIAGAKVQQGIGEKQAAFLVSPRSGI